MRDFPGLYWDQEKNRYFCISSKPAQSSPISQLQGTRPHLSPSNATTPSKTPTERSLKRKRGNQSWRASEGLRGSVFETQIRRCTHEVLCSHIVSTSRVTKIPVPDPTHSSITAFKTTTVNGCIRMFYGDTNGWLYSYTGHSEDALEPGFWMPELNLASEISSICISDARCVATSFGPQSKILVQDLSFTNTSILSPGKSSVHDLWTSHLRGRNLALGANKKAIFLKDIDTARSIHILDTQSDVFTVEQQENLVYTGARNGSIARFDTRVSDPRGQKLLDDVFKVQANSITKLNIVRDWQLIIANINGSLGSYDLRFARGSTPLMTFSGHINSYSNKLALTVDPSEDFLFAAGQDMRIRAWSLRTGNALHPPLSASAPHVAELGQDTAGNPFDMVFSQPVVAMQITEERNVMLLWAASDKNLFRYHLGQRGC